jgi:hypothetical protein
MGHPDLLESVGIGTSVFSHCGYLRNVLFCATSVGYFKTLSKHA